MRRTLCTILLFTAIGGCSHLTPRTQALKDVHAVYRAEFVQVMVPAPGGTPTAAEAKAGEPAFAGTLRAIRDFRTQYGEDSPEAAHLQVLEGMVYLQSGRIGMARVVSPDVQAARAKLKSGTDEYTRDALLAANFDDLITGWEQIQFHEDDSDATIATDAPLAQAAAGIEQQLGTLDRTKLAAPEVDEGAIYLATSAAIFDVWVFKLKSDSGTLREGEQTLWFAKGRDLIGKFLNESEKQAAASGLTGKESSPLGRLRYLDWYAFLSRKAGAGP